MSGRSDHGFWLHGTRQVNLSKISNLLHFDYALTLLEEATDHNRCENSFVNQKVQPESATRKKN